MTNQTFHVLDGDLAPRPDWVPGQLYIGGIGLARGYWGDGEKTRASFLAHPRTGERLYRTGDLGRSLPDGTIEFLGREDFQVKVAGYRVELGEIEAVLARHPAVREAVVAALGEPRGNKRLVAYVVPRENGGDGGADLEADLRGHLRARLPEYMVPAVFLFLEALPLTANGKLDRKALPSPDLAHASRGYEPPQTPAEEILAAIWAEVLGLDCGRIGRHDNFFALGGDSVLAIQIIARANAAGLALTARQLFEHQTVAELAAVLPAAVEPLAMPEMGDSGDTDFLGANLSEDDLARFLAGFTGDAPSE
jgi:aryl carrier-like protein